MFWELSPNRLKPYLIAYDNIEKRKNRDMWIQGLYIMNAVGACFSKDAKYPSEPIDFTPKTIEEQVEEADFKFRQYAMARNEKNKKSECHGAPQE